MRHDVTLHALLACGLLVWAIPHSLAAEMPAKLSLPDYTVSRYTVEHGLPHNTVRSLLQTSDGYLWIGTLAGLARFDGVEFEVFNMSNTPEMSQDSINALAEDRRDGALWINTGNELLRYHQHCFQRFDQAHGYPHPFGDLWPARQGGLWYSPRAGQLVLLQKNQARSWQIFPERVSEQGPEILGHRINQIDEEESGALLILIYNNLFSFDPANGRLRQVGPPVFTDRSYHRFLRQPDGAILIAAREGIWRGKPNQWEHLETVPADSKSSPSWIVPSSAGHFWVPWEREGPPLLARFKEGHSQFVDLSSLPDYRMNRFLEDREGQVWIGTESGLSLLRPKVIQVYSRREGLRNDYVRTVTAGPDGTIWVGTDEGLSGIKEGQVTNLPPIAPGNWGRAEGLLAERGGRLRYGLYANSVAAFENGSWSAPITFAEALGWVRTLYEDQQGRVWVALDHGVAWLDQADQVQVLPHELSHPDVRVIHQDRRGDLWFGTYGGGLNRLRHGILTSHATALDEFNNRAWCIHEDAEGVFWVGSRNGLNRFLPPVADESGQFFTFNTRHGLHENIIHSIQEDDSGHLWFSGPQGIYRVARHELNEVASGQLERAHVLVFGEAEGMLNSQCNGGANQPAGCKDHTGRIWFPTAKGVAVVDPREIRRNELPPPVMIKQVLADGLVIYGDLKITDAHAQNPAAENRNLSRPGAPLGPIGPRLSAGRARVIEIQYTATSFAAPHRMHFKYRLDGYDREWRDDRQNRRVVFYTNLRPGRYAFQVMACNNHGVWSQAPAELAFTLAPYFWQTWWFYLLAAFLLLVLGGLIQAYRLRWQHRLLKLEHRRALADERTRIARDLHDDLGTSLVGLALQVDVVCQGTHEPPAILSRLMEISSGIRSLSERMREVVWVVNPRCDTLPSLAGFLEQQADQILKSSSARIRLQFPEDIPPLPLDGETRHHLALAVREALSNALRHSSAGEITFGFEMTHGQLKVWVADDGQGFCYHDCKAYGRGLTNMQARLETIGGLFECRTAPGQGTTVEMLVPLRREGSQERDE